MSKEISKMIVLPQDGSAFARKSLDYLHLLFGSNHALSPVCLYILPSVPPMLLEAGRSRNETARHLAKIKKRNNNLAAEILDNAKAALIQNNFSQEKIRTVCRERKSDIARDIVDWAHHQMADAILLNCHGRSRVEAFFMGEVSLKLLECSGSCPVWLLRGNVEKKDVLVAVDASDDALRAVDCAGFMLNGTQSRIVLFHTKRSLRRFLPKVLFEDIQGISELWAEQSAAEIAPVMEKARKMLLSAGIAEDRIRVETFDGSRNPADDILSAADQYECGSIVLGRQGASGNKGFSMGSIARKVIDAASDKAIWIV